MSQRPIKIFCIKIQFVSQVGSNAFYGGENCRVDSLEFEGRTKKAFAQLTCINNEDISIRMPALLVQLACEDYLKVKFL